ncbi:hypothetical protein [Paenibacillus sp. HB172176]|uniref:hypothetical protein n=1 Tax=Paenibacillus sp. HB172176 TaxID=2493690 RepID=UPI0014395F9E|nr:hypothetical protein [Paenibacillus sp. HB172176]
MKKIFKPLLLSLCALFVLLSACPSAFASPQDKQPQKSAKFAAVGEQTTSRPVQVFDIAAGKVIKSIPNDQAFQKMAGDWIDSITGLSPQISNDNSCTYVFRVPLNEPVTVASGNLSLTTADLFLFYCKDKPPLLLVFDGQRKPYLFLFKANIKPFMKKTGML